MTPRRVPTNLDPPPAEILTADELARAEQWKRVYELATYWDIPPSEVKRRLFIRGLVAVGAIGKGDRS